MILHVGDRYNRIVDVMNICFSWSYKACMKRFYALNKNKRTYAWFPKIADLSGGLPKPGDKWYDWCNTMSTDGRFIYSNNFEDPQRLDMIPETDGMEPNVTFVRFQGDNQYTYVGVYTQIKKDKTLGLIYERIAENIDTIQYL